MYDIGREGKEGHTSGVRISAAFSLFLQVQSKHYEYEKHEFLRQTEKGVGVNCGVHKMCVFFLSSSKVSHISKGFYHN